MRISSMPRALRRPASVLAGLSLALALGACAGPAADEQEQEQALDQARQAADAAASPAPEATVTPPPAGNCDASQVQGLVGQPYTDALGEQARQDAGASQLRLLKPEQMTTMEYIGERLNIEVDANDQITGVRCG